MRAAWSSLFFCALAAPAGAAGFEPTPCPAAVAAVADCHVAQDGNGAWLLAAIPRVGHDRLVLHAHGGPRLGPPQRDDGREDLERFGAMVREGWAWIGTTYRRGGYGVRSAAADVENARLAFEARWGRPALVVLHGQSWGGNVAAKASELAALDLDGRPRWHGVLLTNGVLMGGTQAYGFRADLRAVYQFVCHNHPRPDEAQYPLWQGLPAGAAMTKDELAARVDECTGVSLPPAQRSAAQAANLRDVLAASGVAEAQLVSHLAWGTFHFQDLVHRRLDGRNPFDNHATVYRGTRDDEALAAGVPRFRADPRALAKLGYDADLSGQIVLPTLAVHARHDPVVRASADADYARAVERAGRGDLYVHVLTDESDHSRLSDATLRTALRALAQWLEQGAAPTPAAIAESCIASEGAARCRFRP